LRKESEERSFTPFRMTTSGKRLVRARFGGGEDLAEEGADKEKCRVGREEWREAGGGKSRSLTRQSAAVRDDYAYWIERGEIPRLAALAQDDT